MAKKYYSRDQQRSSSRKRSTSRTRKKDTTKVVEDDVTVDTEEDSVFDSILSTCCCASPGSGQNSILDKDENEQKNKNDMGDEQPKLWERVSDMALFLIGAAPPVKFVKCLEDGSVDDSTLTNPRVLNELAHEYDMNNKWKVAQSMQGWGHNNDNDGLNQHPIDNVDQVSMSTSDEYHNSTRLRPLGGGLTHRRSGSSGSRWGGALKLVRTNSSSKISKSRSAYTDSQLSKAKRAYGPERYPSVASHDYPDEMTRTSSGRSMTRTSSSGNRSTRKGKVSYRPPSSPRRQTASAPSVCGTQGGGYPLSSSYCNRSTSSGKQKKTSRLRRSIRVEI